jgi:hypothetical protein
VVEAREAAPRTFGRAVWMLAPLGFRSLGDALPSLVPLQSGRKNGVDS